MSSSNARTTFLPSSSTRLPLNNKPLHYRLTLTPLLRTKTFTGKVTITLRTDEVIISLKLHVLDLTIHSTNITSSPSSLPLAIASTSTNYDAQTYKILLEHCVPANTELALTLTFSGALKANGEDVGWFLPGGCQEEEDGEGEGFATTHFEPMWARTVFPCFDAPSFKAVFEVALVVERRMKVLGNMPIKSTEDLLLANDGDVEELKKIVHFEATPQIATHLLAFAVGQFNYVEIPPLGDEKVPIRAYVPQGADYNIDHTRYALNVVRRTISLLSSLLLSPFPYPKLDLLLVPGSTGGMENPGLVTLSTSALLTSPETSARDKATSTQTLIHEVAHMWFGNLISLKSWDGFWWKEGLCEWIECEARERLWGNSDAWIDWVTDGLQTALYNASFSNHALEVVIDGQDVTKPFFDEISYKKGCAVLRMLECYMGNDIFVEGLRVFVQLNAGGSADSGDLWSAMSHVSGADVGAFMRPWMKSASVPVVTVEEDGESGKVKISQLPFRMIASNDKTEHEDLLPIPLEIANATGMGGDLLRTKSKVMKLPSDFHTVNAGHVGFFRVVYSPHRLQRISEEIKKGNLPIEDRIGFISNAAALCFSGHPSMRTSQLLSLLQSFEDEESFFVWKMIIEVLNELKRYLLWENEKVKNAFETFWRHLVQKCLYKKSQFSVDDDLNEQRFKSLMFGNAGGDEKVFAAAELIFDRFVRNEGKSINPNLRAEVFKLILSQKGRKEYLELRSRLKDCTIAERQDILRSLGYSEESSCIKKTIKQAMSKESIAGNKMACIFKSLCSHQKGAAAVWKFLTSGVWVGNRQLSVEKLVPIGSFLFTSYSTREQAEAVKTYLDDLSGISEFGSDVTKVLELIEVKARWLERDKLDLIDWLERHGHSQSKHSRSTIGVFQRMNGLWGLS